MAPAAETVHDRPGRERSDGGRTDHGAGEAPAGFVILQPLADGAARAERLLETACELELEPGVAVQWFAVRLEPPSLS